MSMFCRISSLKSFRFSRVRSFTPTRYVASNTSPISKIVSKDKSYLVIGTALLLVGGSYGSSDERKVKSTTFCDGRKLGNDVVMLGPTAEPSTGILFPRLVNGLTFVGCGVRVKWRFIKVYAVGTYVDPIAMAAIKKQGKEDIRKALCDPMYPRTIRIVMNRNLSIDKFMNAIVESLEPRMNGQDLDKLEEFKKLNPSIDLIEGAEIEMTIRGSTLLYKNSVGVVGAIQSDVFCRALCDVYYGNDAVSSVHRDNVIEGIMAL